MSNPNTTPFADETGSFEVGGLTIENGTAAIAIYGQMDLTRDKAGLERARAVLAFMQAAVTVLEADTALPDRIPAPKPKGSVKNPFS